MTGTLLVDAGNSRLKWRWLGVGADADRAAPNSELDQLVPASWEGLEAPGRILVSAVRGKTFREHFNQSLHRLWGMEGEFVQSGNSLLGVTNGYRDPGQLGVDRWLALVCAWYKLRSAVVVVDAGTVMTLDLVTKPGHFAGGMMVPGLALSLDVFRQRVPHLELGELNTDQFPADNTADAISLGVGSSAVAVIMQFIDNAASLCGTAPTLVLTGGDAGWLESRIPRQCHCFDNLVLDGLQVIAEQL